MSTAVQKSGNESRLFVKLAQQTDESEGYTHPHATRIATLADELAKHFGLASKDRQSLRVAALLHDLGQKVMERDYLKRGGALTDEERLDLSRHPIIGEQEAGNAGADRAAQLLIRWHHEWWNGSGYPDALRREEIPLGARILRVADSYAAITDARPQRAALNIATARQHLLDWAGIEFDPKMVSVFLTLESLPELESYAEADHREEGATGVIKTETLPPEVAVFDK